MQRWIFKICIVFSWFYLNGQTVENNHFFIEGDQIVLQFTKEQWRAGVKDTSSVIFDFRDFEIEDELNSGLITQWTKDGWILRSIDPEIFQLRKKWSDFNHDFSNMVKYQINSQLWKSPTSEPISNLDVSTKPIKKVKEIKVDKNGNTVFKLKGFSAAKKVILCGSFNQWNEQAIVMQKQNWGWQVTMDLPPGIYEYKFIIDGEWTHDLSNPLSVPNEHFTLNSILLVGDYITFKLKGYHHAKRVVLAGSFNNWDEKNMRMKKSKDGWEYTIPLPPGKHYYQFIVDGQWTLDPENVMRQRDHNNYINSVLLIH